MKEIEIIYEDENFVAVNKPAGLLVHSIKVRDKGSEIKKGELTLVDWIIEKYPDIKKVGDDPEMRPGIVHRLDKNTSGVIIIAKNQEYFDYLKKFFQTHEMKKIYFALVYGRVKENKGVIEKPISLKADSIKRTVWDGKMTKEAITEYKVLKRFLKDNSEFTLLQAEPKTGRTHQIRIHFSSIGHPIVGDSLYGPKENLFGLHRQFLHAHSLEFSKSNGQRIKIEADLPEELSAIIDTLKKNV